MVVKISFNGGKHYNFFAGTHVGFHPRGSTWKEGLDIVVEGGQGKECANIPIDAESNTQIYLMNDLGKTIEKIFV